MMLREFSALFMFAALLTLPVAPAVECQEGSAGDKASADPQRAAGQGAATDAGADQGGAPETEGKDGTPDKAAAEVKPPTSTLRGWAQELERAGTRLIYYRETPGGAWTESPGQIAITYSKVPWQKEYETSLDKLLDTSSPDAPKIQRWRLGKNFWTTLDARLPMTVGGVEIAPGYYYLALELDRTTEPRFSLCLLDPTEVTEQRLDAWHLDKKDAPILTRVPLTHTRVDKGLAKKDLTIVFLIEPKDPTRADLQITFGHHTATAQVVVDVTADGK